ncbi:MAG: hypothetical protein ACI94Y_002673 [Maribacter sp.]|jgi:hypothetical protein
MKFKGIRIADFENIYKFYATLNNFSVKPVDKWYEVRIHFLSI